MIIINNSITLLGLLQFPHIFAIYWMIFPNSAAYLALNPLIENH